MPFERAGSVAVLAMCLATPACAYESKTSVTVRDPTAVRVEVQGAKGETVVVLPASAVSRAANVPTTSPPFDDEFSLAIALQRGPGGAPISARCNDCSPEERTLVDAAGHVLFDTDMGMGQIDWKVQPELRIPYHDARENSDDLKVGYAATLATPWSNVAEVRRERTPNRALGLRLTLSAAVCGALSVFALQNGLSQTNKATTTTILGSALVPIAIALGSGGLWYLLAPQQRDVLYGGK